MVYEEKIRKGFGQDHLEKLQKEHETNEKKKSWFKRRKDKKKTRIVKLVQSPKKKALIINLAPEEKGMVTGPMSECCSVVVLWGEFVNHSDYVFMRGQHGGGGPESINWKRLLSNIPVGLKTKVVMSCAKDEYASYTEKVAQALKDNKFNICKKGFYQFSNALILRDGSVARFENEEDYVVRFAYANPVI